MFCLVQRKVPFQMHDKQQKLIWIKLFNVKNLKLLKENNGLCYHVAPLFASTPLRVFELDQFQPDRRIEVFQDMNFSESFRKIWPW